MYKIQIYYETGDSFGHQPATKVLEFEWKDPDVVKENLKRIRDHYKWYESKTSIFEDELPRPEWHLNMPKSQYGMDETRIMFKMDDGKEVQIYAFWVGYFEQLHSAKILTDNSEWEFTA